jgi:gliding motility-associated-like protein
MYIKCRHYCVTGIVTPLILAFIAGTTNAQPVLCPPNLDFENGDFSNWVCRTGSVSGAGGQNTITWLGTGQVFNRHTIIPASDVSVDPYGNFPVSCPNGSGYSIRLGNNQTGAQAEGVFYTYSIPPTVTTFSIIYYYAIVLFNPNHSSFEQPRFIAQIIDESTNALINCVSFDFTASGSLPGFQPSPANPMVLYRDWTPITLDLSSYAGKTIRLEFITSDCTQGGHFGYAYVDVNASCNGAIIGSTICQGDTTASLIAPFGFQSYEWYSDNSFAQFLGTSQTLALDPAPQVGAIYPVIVTPFPGFGCKDTLYAQITTAQKPVSVAGPDAIACRNQPFQLGGPPTLGYAYSWTPANLLNNPASSSPYAINNSFAPAMFIIKTMDLGTGCFSYDTTVISIAPVDTSLAFAGKTAYCIGETMNTTLSVSNSLAAVQWYQDNTIVGGATGISYQPVGTGNYWAQVSQNGCTDSTRQQSIAIHPRPQVSFYADKDTQCVNGSFQFNNTTVISPNEPMSYLWKFSDGTFSQISSAVKTFDVTGNYTIELVATSVNSCKDSIAQVVSVMPNAEPDFLWDSICIGRSAQFRNLTNENGTPLASYHWDFKNGVTNDTKDPPAFNYDNAGDYDVTLTIATLGCESEPRTIIKKVWANPVIPGIRYRDITVAERYTTYIVARDTIGKIYEWQPSMQLNNYSVKRPFFTAIDDVKYLIRITDEHTCITIDTLQMLVLKKPGIYLPSAFTPNGDGLNDVIKPYLVGMKSLKRFTIYNRNGNIIFSTTKQGEGWNGTYQGQQTGAGVFVWVVEYTGTDDKSLLQKGTITLVR